MTLIRTVIGISALSLPALAQAQAPPHFRAVVIPTIAQLFFDYAAINDSGRIALTVWTANGEIHGQIWDSPNGDPFLVTLAPGSTQDLLLGLNESGDAVGSSRYEVPGGSTWGAALCHDGVLRTLSNPLDGQARQINDAGVVAGFSGANRPVLWNLDGTTVTLSVPTAYGGAAVGVNIHGVVAGWVQTSLDALAPAVWSGGQRTLLPTMGSVWAEAVRINDAGQVLCIWRDSAGDTRTYRWTSGVVEEIGLGSSGRVEGFDMNQAGQCVGTAEAGAILFQDGVTYDLFGLVVNHVEGVQRFYQASAINNLGQIVVIGAGFNGIDTPLLLTPTHCGSRDFDNDGDSGSDADIVAFFACLAGDCCATCDPDGADFNGDGDTGTDADIEAFFRVLGGGSC